MSLLTLWFFGSLLSRRRKSSSGSVSNLVTDDNRNEDCGQNLDLMREAITLSSVPQQKRRELEERIDNAQQVC